MYTVTYEVSNPNSQGIITCNIAYMIPPRDWVIVDNNRNKIPDIVKLTWTLNVSNFKGSDTAGVTVTEISPRNSIIIVRIKVDGQLVLEDEMGNIGGTGEAQYTYPLPPDEAW
ncbi:MAG: hypothetical protein U0401_28490 [Anaerolineae bacterium]